MDPKSSASISELMTTWERRDIYKESGFDAYRVLAYTQSASDALTVCTGLASHTSYVILDHESYVASRGPFRAYGTYDRLMNPGVSQGCYVPNVKSFTMPRYGVPDVIEFWKRRRTPMPADEEALKQMEPFVVPASVVILETVSNHIYNGALSAYFLDKVSKMCRRAGAYLVLDETLVSIRCGRLWSFEYLTPSIYVSAILFGKAHYTSGVCTRKSLYSSMSKLIGTATRPGFGPVIYAATQILKHARKRLETNIDEEVRKFQASITEAFHAQMSDVQWFGFLGGARLTSTEFDEWDEAITLSSDTTKLRCVRMQDHLRLLGWVMSDIGVK